MLQADADGVDTIVALEFLKLEARMFGILPAQKVSSLGIPLDVRGKCENKRQKWRVVRERIN